MKDLYVTHEIKDADLADRFNITLDRLRRLMKKEGVYKRSKKKAPG